MKRDRLVYVAVIVVTLILLILFQGRFLLWLAAVELLLPLVIYMLLRIETAHMTVELLLPKGVVAGEDSTVGFYVHGRKLFAALGRIRIVLNFHNELYDRDVEQEIHIPAAYVSRVFEGNMRASMCGAESVTCKTIECYGVFDMCRVHIKPCPQQRMVVIPRETMTTLVQDKRSWGYLDGEQTDTRKRGNDPAEVFDIREYQNGDDIRAIHWKLSSKLDKILVKEAGYAAHFDTIVLFDGGEQSSGKMCSDDVLAGVIDFGITFSRKLLELQRPHCVGMFLKDTFVGMELQELSELASVVQQSMSVPVQKENGRALSYFMANELYNRYSRIIYIVNGDFPDKLYEFAGMVQLVAICITDRVDELTTMKKGKSTLIEIPVNGLYDQAHYISV